MIEKTKRTNRPSEMNWNEKQKNSEASAKVLTAFQFLEIY